MGFKDFFKKNKKNSANESVAQESNEKNGKIKAKKKTKELVSSVVNETVEAEVLAILDNNNFYKVRNDDGKIFYVAYLLDCENIGGLNKKTVNDESKGALVNEINSSHVNVIADKELMDDNKLIIIPTPTTIETLQEYQSIFESVPLPIVLITEHMEIIDTKFAVTLGGLFEIDSIDDRPLEDILAENEVEGFSLEEEPIEQEEPKLGDEVEEEYQKEIDEDAGISTEIEDEDFNEDDTVELMEDGEEENEEFNKSDDTASGFDDNTDIQEDEVDQDNGFNEFDNDFREDDGYDEPSEYDGYSDEEYVEDNINEKVTDAIIQESLTRTLYPEDLNITVSTDLFDAQYIKQNPLILFETNRESGLTNDYLNNLSRRANESITRLHTKNLVNARTLFYERLVGITTAIENKFSRKAYKPYIENAESLQAAADSQKAELEETISKKKDERTKKYDDARAKFVEQAVVEAEMTYDKRNKLQLNDDLSQIEKTERDNFQADFNNRLKQFDDERIANATRVYEYMVNGLLVDVGKIYKESLKSEELQYQNYENQMLDFIESNRQNDIAHDKVLQEELDKRVEVNKLREEYNNALDSQLNEYQIKLDSIQNEYNALIKANNEQIDRLKVEHSEKMALVSSDKEQLQARIDKLLEDYAALGDKKNEEYERLLKDKDNQIALIQKQSDDNLKSRNKLNTITSLLFLISVVASTLCGILLGKFFSGLNLF